jgi:hypothetical protein
MDQLGPPRKLQEWQGAWEAGRDDYEDLNDNVPLPSRLRASFFEKGGDVIDVTCLLRRTPTNYISPALLGNPGDSYKGNYGNSSPSQLTLCSSQPRR